MGKAAASPLPERVNRRWLRIAIYYAVALGLSFLARIIWQTSNLADPRQGAWGMYRHLFSGVGPFLGALLVWALFRPERRMRFGGTWPAMSLAMLAVPAIVLGIMGVANPFGVDAHLFGVHLGVWIAIYAILEETGWRGYLQDEFRQRQALLKYAIVGLFWYAWHFSWLGGHSAGSEAASLAFMIAASIGIGFVADRTRSIFAAAAFHVLGNVMGTTTDFAALIPSQQTRWMIVLACVVVWLIMLRLWGMRDKRIVAFTAQEVTGPT
jgi:membrane protease YdiL (CAAX protease family)